MLQESRIMPDDQIPDIFHGYKGWMEVREKIMEGLSKGLWKMKFSSVPSPPNSESSEESDLDSLMELYVFKRKPEEESTKEKKSPPKSKPEEESTKENKSPPKRKPEEEPKKSKTLKEPEESQKKDESPYSNFDLNNFLSQGEAGGNYLSEQKHIAKQEIFEEFFEKCNASYPHEEFGNETDKNVHERFKILKVLKKNKEPALEEWIKACIENDVGPTEGSSMNYCIFDKNDFGHDLRVMEKDLQQPSTSSQQDEYNDFPDSGVPGSVPDCGVFGSVPDSGVLGSVPDSGILGSVPDSGVPDSGVEGSLVQSNTGTSSWLNTCEVFYPDSVNSDNEVSCDSEEDDQSDDKLDLFSFLSNPFKDPDRNAERDSDQQLTSAEAAIFSFLSNPLKHPDRNAERYSDQHLTSAEPAISEMFVYDNSGIPYSEIIPDLQHPLSSSIEQDMCDEYDIDYDLLVKVGLRPQKKHATEAMAESDDGNLSLYTTSSSSSNRKGREFFYSFAGKIEKDDIKESENLLPFTELSIFSDSKDQMTNVKTLPVTKANENPISENVYKLAFPNQRLKSSLDYIISNPEEIEKFASPQKASGSAAFTESIENDDGPAIVPISPESQTFDNVEFEYH